jgi:hypothetical protein
MNELHPISAHRPLVYRVRRGCLLSAVIFAGTVGLQAPIHGAAVPTLLENSPFLPPDFSPPEANASRRAVRATPNAYEFKGVYELGGDYRFLVKATQASSGKWVEAGKAYEDFEIRGYDAEDQILTLFHNEKEERLELVQLEANPTPMPVSGQPAATAAPTPAEDRSSARRVVRPPSRSSTDRSSSGTPPPPAWLQKLRQEAAERRSSPGGSGGLPSAGVGPTGSASKIPPAPTYKPPTPPPNLTEANIPPPPTGLPPEPPPEIMEQIRQSLSTRPGT